MFNAHARKVATKAALDALKSVESADRVDLRCISDPEDSPHREWWFATDDMDSRDTGYVLKMTEDLNRVRVYRYSETLKLADD